MTKKKRLMSSLTGVLVPIMAWVVIAAMSKSPYIPQHNFHTFAATYLSDDRNDATSIDVYISAGKEFTNSWQILKKYPKKVFKTYLKDFYQNFARLFSYSSLIPLSGMLLTLPGLILLFFKSFDRFKLCVLIVLASLFFLANFHVWLDRLYLFAIPFLGAGCIVFWAHLNKMLTKSIFKVLLFLFVFSFAAGFVSDARQGYTDLFKQANASDAIAASRILLNRQISADSLIFARKPHLGYYAKAESRLLPNVETIEELRESIKKVSLHASDYSSIYLFYGLTEKIARPLLIDLANPGYQVPWLKTISLGHESGGWALYKIIREKL
jgi:hypothetical protein